MPLRTRKVTQKKLGEIIKSLNGVCFQSVEPLLSEPIATEKGNYRVVTLLDDD